MEVTHLQTDEMPNIWNQAVIQPLLKKGDAKKYEKYRGIALLDVTHKIIAMAIYTKMFLIM